MSKEPVLDSNVQNGKKPVVKPPFLSLQLVTIRLQNIIMSSLKRLLTMKPTGLKLNKRLWREI